VQVDPIKSTLKPTGTKLLKLCCDEPPSNFAFKFKLRRYIEVFPDLWIPVPEMELRVLVGAVSGRAVQVDGIKPTLKAPGNTCLRLKCHKLLSRRAFKFNLRRYTAGRPAGAGASQLTRQSAVVRGSTGAGQVTSRPAGAGARQVAGRPVGARQRGIARCQSKQGPTLVHFSAQRKRFVWVKGTHLRVV